MSASPRQEWALHLASLGFRIFPLRPGTKKPYEGSWKDRATTDPDTIREWFRHNPEMNYGVNPGDRYVVVDIDRKPDEADGLEAFANAALEAGDLGLADVEDCDSFVVRTPSGNGGLHLYLKTDRPVGSSDSEWPDGINVRGAGGYVVGPGSYVDEGEGRRGGYEVVRDHDPAKAPSWASERFRSGSERAESADAPLFDLDTDAAVARAREFLQRRKPAIEGYGGDQHTLVTAMQLRDIGVSAEKAVELMAEPSGWNERCEPPWDLPELETKVKNAYRYARNQPGAKASGEDVFGGDDEIQDISQVAALEKYNEERGGGENFEHLRSILFKGGQIKSRGKRREMIVPEWLPAHGLTAVNAKRGMGKTVTMVDLAVRISLKCEDTDVQWMGQPIEDDWAVVYICGEDDEGLEEQLRAWTKHYGYDLPEDRFYVMAGTVDLMSADSVETWTRFLKEELGSRRAVVFVDTWQRASSRGGQNKDEDMQLAIHHVEAMAKSLNGPVVAAFHPPKNGDKTLLGSSVIENSTTAIWELDDSNGARKLEVTRIKGKGTGNYQLFEFKEVYLDEQDAFGKERSGVVANRIGGVEDNEAAVNKSESIRATMAEIILEIEEHRIRLDPTTKRKLTPKEVDRFIGEGGYYTEWLGERDEHGEFTDRAKAAQKALERLREVGYSFKRYRDKLPELFKNHPYDLGDGYVLKLVYQSQRLSYFEKAREGLAPE